MIQTIRVFSLARYLEAALQLATYEPDEDGVIVARVPGAAGFYSQGETEAEARENLVDAIEGNVLIALQLGLLIPAMPGVAIEEQRVEAVAT